MSHPPDTQAPPLRMALAAACAWVTLGAASAPAALLFVDGDCPTSGTGENLACGPTGAFTTIAEGILAMQPGDTLDIRGAHGSFDGVYFEELMLRDGAALPGKALACTAAEPCVIQGCRMPECPTNDQPVVRGMTRHDDWVEVTPGGGVFARAMEPSPNPDGLERDPFDPHMLLEGSATPLVPMAYAGDGVAAPGDGEWSYDPATHEVAVNPTGAADPMLTVYVPHHAYNVHVQSPSSYLTLAHLTFEGTRGRSIEIESFLPHEVTNAVLSHLVQRYVPRYFVIAVRTAPGLVIEDSLAEYGCRGLSWALPTNGGCMGYRLFGIHGGTVRRNIVRHLGATGRQKLSNPGPPGWPCPWCDPPWNDPTHTDVSTYGLAYQVKQTDTATIEDNRVEDVATGGVSLDVARGVTVQRNTVHRAATGLGLLNFTQTGGCPSTAPTEFCYNSDHVIRDNVFDEVGYADVTGCGVEIIAGSERHDGGTMLAAVYNNVISRVGFAGICVQNEGRTPTADLSIANNTVYGARAVLGAEPSSGLVIVDATQNVDVRNNIFDALTSDGLVVTTAGAQGLSLDGDVMGTVAGCQVRWGDGAGCDLLALHETHGRTGALQFADVTAAPFDLHLTIGSVAIDAGVPGGPSSDFDGDPRPLGLGWDAGADEYDGPLPSTTTTMTSSTTTSTRMAGSTTSSSTTPSSVTSSSTSTSTATTAPTTLTTISTLPLRLIADRLSGQTLLLKVAAKRPSGRRVRVVSIDRAKLTLSDVADIPALLAEGGSLRIAAIGGDGFAKTYALDAAEWQPIDPARPARGVRYRDDDGPINRVRFEVGKRLLAEGKGPELDQSLEREPAVVEVELRLGSHVFCLAFGGKQQQFASRKRLRRAKAHRPETCPES